jgi:type II secretory pathway predicted ATPase ExeA
MLSSLRTYILVTRLNVCDDDEVASLIKWRLKEAGRRKRLFTNAAIRRIAQRSGGLPLGICYYAHESCLNRYARRAEHVGIEDVERVGDFE